MMIMKFIVFIAVLLPLFEKLEAKKSVIDFFSKPKLANWKLRQYNYLFETFFRNFNPVKDWILATVV